MSLYAEMRAYLENGPARDVMDGIPTAYSGTVFRSRLEAGWACTLDRYGIRWEYEPELAVLPSGVRYLPDFRLPDLATVLEVKGPHMQRLDKTREYAKENCPATIVIIGYPPQRRTLSPYLWEGFMQWGDALGYNALFTQCLSCLAYQWCRPRFSMSCRCCNERFTGHFAGCGEMRSDDWKEQPYEPPEFRKGIVLMPWVRFDDQFPIHRKVDGLSDAAYRLHTSAIFWCARNLTDGFVSEEDLDGVSARVRTPARFAAECVKRGVWHDARQSCPSERCPASVENDYPQGWVIHDYWEYQPSKADVLKERQASAERQRKWREARSHGKSKRNGSSNGVTNGVDNGYPAPPRPEGSGAGGARPGRTAADGRANPAGSPDRGTKPPWCGECDERTRLTDDDQPRRCPRCHPATAEATA